MSAPYLGGTRFIFIGWFGPSAIRVDFESIYGSAYHYQLYAGRTLIGQTYSPSERFISAPLIPTDWPQWLQLVTVDPAERLTDYGSSLPDRPYNKAEISVTTSSWPSDSKVIEVSSGTVPGGAVDTANIVARQNWRTDTTYAMTTTPCGPSGSWNFQVAGRDDKPIDGNRGTALALSATLLTQPRDYALTAEGARFDVSATAGTATVSFTYRD